MNCLRFLKISKLDDICRMTFYEYDLRMKAYRLQTIDEEYKYHRQAWVNREVNAERKKGKNCSEYVYKKFEDFFDYEKFVEMVNVGKVERKASSSTASRYMDFMERREKNGEL